LEQRVISTGIWNVWKYARTRQSPAAFAGAVRAVGGQRRLLGEFQIRPVFGQRAINFVGADLQELSRRLGFGHVQQHLRADDIGLHERPGAENAAIDMALGGEMHDFGDAVIVPDLLHLLGIADVPLTKVRRSSPRRSARLARLPA
jgi:hypothetical protein